MFFSQAAAELPAVKIYGRLSMHGTAPELTNAA